MYLDFSAIKTGEDFELLCEDLLECIGFEIESKPARGPDRGRDIIASQTLIDGLGIKDKHRYLIECKHYAVSGKSVRETDIGNPIPKMSTHSCDRYLLITSTVPSENVQAQLSAISNAVPTYKATIWSKGDLRKYLNKYPEVIKRYFKPESNFINTHLEEVVKTFKEYMRLPDKLSNIKKLLLQNPQILPIEAYMSSHYEYRNEIQFPDGRMIDCFAVRPDSGGIRGYMYYLGSPYEDPFTDSGQPKKELKFLLDSAYNHTSLAIQILSQEHILHPAIIMGQDSAGMKRKYFAQRRMRGFGPYAELNIYIIVGQRAYYNEMYEINRL
ncbi:MAG TPA: restriction endonuclease [Trichormus sp. M33_DOE_039]|nr:restriction endonuclease [Trichormus sp. M33_DOE_039]